VRLAGRIQSHPQRIIATPRGLGFAILIVIAILCHDRAYIMKPESALASCYQKTEWAKTAIDDLQAEIRQFVSRDPYKIVAKVDVETGEEVWRFKIDRLPRGIKISVENILANLRDPLDNMLAILSDKHRGKDDSVSFPFGSEMKHYDTELGKIEKLLPRGAAELIRKAETYPGGNAHLRALHFLNRNKKHRVPIAPFNTSTSVAMQALAVFKGGKLLRIGFKNGKHLVPIPPNGNLSQPDPAKMPAFIPDHGFVFVPAPGDDEMEVLATVPGTQFYCHFQPTLDVAFTNTPGIEREPICVALHQMRELVDGVLLTFERRFFE